MTAPLAYYRPDAPTEEAHGHQFTETQIQEIISKLKETEMSISALANTFGCARNSVLEINKLFGVRA